MATLCSHLQPSTIKELQQFLGQLNFYRKFIPAAALMLVPLLEAVKGSPAVSSLIPWTSSMQAAFDAAKDSLTIPTELSHPSTGAKVAQVADASSSHVGAALH